MDSATTAIYTLSLHDALPICATVGARNRVARGRRRPSRFSISANSRTADRKSTRLNSSHRCISYAVFCLKKKNKARAKKQGRAATTRGVAGRQSTDLAERSDL